MNTEKVKLKKGSTNCFKDSGFSNPEEFMRARFVSIIRDILVEHELGQDEALETLEISESELAVLQADRFADFSLDCLLLLLEKLGFGIEFVSHEIPAGATSKGFRISTSF